ncbi:hypothetical protein [Nocardia neocaledoniensis]|jgi:hypothetical protein|uniref:hypothetical protein n=1 Tax=Nocardia neocaledoniensis TaxID=236511 RepID=UPI0024541F62|nr:hypothetical protein [Nocardia neocaledoniensis]
MTDSADAAIDAWFAGKPHSREIFTVLRELIDACGPELAVLIAAAYRFGAK